jgi:hypothetical protein
MMRSCYAILLMMLRRKVLSDEKECDMMFYTASVFSKFEAVSRWPKVMGMDGDCPKVVAF